LEFANYLANVARLLTVAFDYLKHSNSDEKLTCCSNQPISPAISKQPPTSDYKRNGDHSPPSPIRKPAGQKKLRASITTEPM